jgi:hypothetical protein
MEREMKRIIWRGLMLLVILIGCDSPNTNAYILPKRLTCHTTYRSDVTHPIEQERTVEVTQPMNLSESQQVVFPDLIFELIYTGNNIEGYTIIIAVTDALTNAPPLSKALYQLGSKDLISHDYPGGGGFTGAHVVYHPISRAEVQWWCSAVVK